LFQEHIAKEESLFKKIYKIPVRIETVASVLWLALALSLQLLASGAKEMRTQT
jgi:hypothetical protein